MLLEGDSWEGVRDLGWEVTDPEDSEVIAAVERLDGRKYTEVTIHDEETDEYISVSGGPSFFLVTGELAEGLILHVRGFHESDEVVWLVCGGQRAQFSRRDLVVAGEARAAMLTFLHGVPTPLPDNWYIE